MTMLDVIHTVPTMRVDHGGPPRSIAGMCTALASVEIPVRLVTARAGHVPLLLPELPVESRVVRDRSALGVPVRPIAFREALAREYSMRRPTVIHDHGVWQPVNWTVVTMARRWSVPAIISTKGMLTPWCFNHRAWRKRAGWALYQRNAIASATALHATSVDEARSLRELGLRNAIAVIPYGVHVPPTAADSFGSRRAIFVGRLHPVKGLPNLIDAWARARPSGWTLEIAGPDELDHRRRLEDMVRRLGLGSVVTFAGELNDADKWAHLRSAELFILPSHSENFGVAAAEALAAGLPVITTTGTPWERMVETQCGWRVPSEPEALAKALGTATSLTPERRAEMGARGRALIAREYSWSRMADELRSLYTWAVEGGSLPSCVLPQA